MVPVDEPRRRLRAPRLRRKPSWSIAASTRVAVPGCTPASPLTTRETVFRLPPASRATSFIVARLIRPWPELDNVVIDMRLDTRVTRLSTGDTTNGRKALSRTGQAPAYALTRTG